MSMGYRLFATSLCVALSVGAAAALAEAIADAGKPQHQSFAANSAAAIAAANPAYHSKLIAAFQATQLVDTLRGKGRFTVFAPDDGAFERLPGGTMDKLWKPENKLALKALLSQHLVRGHLSGSDLGRLIDQGHGVATLRAVSGASLLLTRTASHDITIEDESGDIARIDSRDLRQSEGGIFSIDRVLRMPQGNRGVKDADSL